MHHNACRDKKSKVLKKNRYVCDCFDCDKSVFYIYFLFKDKSRTNQYTVYKQNKGLTLELFSFASNQLWESTRLEQVILIYKNQTEWI